jgi:hypothetical protein
MSKIFVESYIANKNHRQGLYARGLSPPPKKPVANADPPPPKNLPQNRYRRRPKTRHRHRSTIAAT